MWKAYPPNDGQMQAPLCAEKKKIIRLKELRRLFESAALFADKYRGSVRVFPCTLRVS